MLYWNNNNNYYYSIKQIEISINNLNCFYSSKYQLKKYVKRQLNKISLLFLPDIRDKLSNKSCFSKLSLSKWHLLHIVSKHRSSKLLFKSEETRDCQRCEIEATRIKLHQRYPHSLRIICVRSIRWNSKHPPYPGNRVYVSRHFHFYSIRVELGGNGWRTI